jgi:hypothetical protein
MIIFDSFAVLIGVLGCMRKIYVTRGVMVGCVFF